MSHNVAGVSPSSLIRSDARRPEEPGVRKAAAPEPAAPYADAGRYRLTIEKGAGGFVYKVLDRQTGEVIRQFPREEILKLRRSADYGPGDVIAIGA